MMVITIDRAQHIEELVIIKMESDGEVPVMLDLSEFVERLYCHRSQVKFGSEWLYLIGSNLWVK